MPTSLSGKYHESAALHVVEAALKAAEKHHLETEVLYTAFVYLKENPEASIEDALHAGLTDWDIEIPF